MELFSWLLCRDMLKYFNPCWFIIWTNSLLLCLKLILLIVLVLFLSFLLINGIILFILLIQMNLYVLLLYSLHGLFNKYNI